MADAKRTNWEQFLPNETQQKKLDQLVEIILPPMQPREENTESKSLDWILNSQSKPEEEVMQYEVSGITIGAALQRLDKFLEECKESKDSIHSALANLSSLEIQYKRVSEQTDGLRSLCETVMKEKEQLEELSAQLEIPLSYFADYEIIRQKLDPNSQDRLTPTDEEFSQLLDRIDDCIDFLDVHPSYRDTQLYRNKYIYLRRMALEQCYNYFSLEMKKLRKCDMEFSGLEVPQSMPQYLSMKAAAQKLRLSIVEIEKRIKPNKDIEEIYRECQSKYFEQRDESLPTAIYAYLSHLMTCLDPEQLTRSSLGLMIQLCQAEISLYASFFTISTEHVGENEDSDHFTRTTVLSDSQSVSELKDYLFQLCNMIYETLRPRILHITDVDVLCQLIHIIKMEIIQEHIYLMSGVSKQVVEAVVRRLLQDSQERLIYRSELFLVSDIENFDPTEDDVDYPNRLTKQFDKEKETVAAITRNWYPVLTLTLTTLSKLYHAVDNAAFEGIAQDFLHVCINKLTDASRRISREKGVFHVSLFLVRHLLILREQISPFDIEFHHTSRALDFSNTADALNRLLRRNSVQQDGTVSSLFDFLPRVTESEINNKEELENNLKYACDSFIVTATNSLIAPLLLWHSKAETLLDDAISECPPEFQASNIGSVIETVHKLILNSIPDLVRNVSVYLHNPSTRSILFKPVKKEIFASILRLRSMIDQSAWLTTDDKHSLFQKLDDVERALQTSLANISSMPSPRLSSPSSNNSSSFGSQEFESEK